MPLYDENPFAAPRRPVVTWSLIAANVLIFLFDGLAGDEQAVVEHFGVVPAALSGDIIIPGALPPTFTLVTYMFVHAGVIHIFGNVVFLWVFGDNVEQALGRGRFLAFYLLCGIVGALAFVVTDVHSATPLVGASGAIAGIVIAYAMLRPCAKVTALVFGIPVRVSAYWIIGGFVMIQFINLGSASKSEVAYWCHIGGMVAGGVLLPFMRQPGVKLFECLRPEQIEADTSPPMPDTSRLPGAPRHAPHVDT